MYLGAALQKPSLFYQSSKTICNHIKWMRALAFLDVIELTKEHNEEANQQGIEPVLYYMMKNPYFLTISKDNYKLRWCYSRLLNKKNSMRNIYKSKKIIQTELEQKYGTSDIQELRQIYKEKKITSPSEVYIKQEFVKTITLTE